MAVELAEKVAALIEATHQIVEVFPLAELAELVGLIAKLVAASNLTNPARLVLVELVEDYSHKMFVKALRVAELAGEASSQASTTRRLLIEAARDDE